MQQVIAQLCTSFESERFVEPGADHVEILISTDSAATRRLATIGAKLGCSRSEALRRLLAVRYSAADQGPQ